MSGLPRPKILEDRAQRLPLVAVHVHDEDNELPTCFRRVMNVEEQARVRLHRTKNFIAAVTHDFLDILAASVESMAGQKASFEPLWDRQGEVAL